MVYSTNDFKPMSESPAFRFQLSGSCDGYNHILIRCLFGQLLFPYPKDGRHEG